MSMWLLSHDEFLRRPGRNLLTLLSIVIAVAAVLAVAASTRSARDAFDRMYEALTGRADAEIVARGGGVFDAAVLEKLDATPGIIGAAPMLRKPTIIYGGDNRKVRMMAIGVDPVRDEKVRDYKLASGRFFSQPGEILLAESRAEELGIKVGGQTKMLSRRGVVSLTIVGLLKLAGTGGFKDGDGVFLSLSDLQRFSKTKKDVDVINLVFDKSLPPEKVLQTVADELPGELLVRITSARTGIAQTTLIAVQQVISLATGLTLLAAAIIILNTFLMNVSERRRQLSISRLIGAKRSQVRNMLLREGLILGIVGAIFGVLVGFALSHLLSTVMSKAFGTPVSASNFSYIDVAFACLAGPIVALAAVAYPALRAAQIAPLEGMLPPAARSIKPARVDWKTAFGGFLVVASGVVFSLAAAQKIVATAAVPAAVFTLIGLILLFPLVLGVFVRVAANILEWRHPIEVDLARRQVLLDRGRTILTAAIMFVATASSIALGCVGSEIIDDLRVWFHRTIVADFIIRPSLPDLSTGETPALPEDVIQKLIEVPGINMAERVSFVAMDAANEKVLAIAREFDKYEHVPLDLSADTDESRVRNALLAGQVVVGDILARRLGIKAGDLIVVQFGGRKQTIEVAGTATAFIAGGSVILLDRAFAQRMLGVQDTTSLMINATDDDRPRVEKTLREISNEQGILFQTQADFGGVIQSLLQAVIGALWVMLALGFAIAGFGITNTLTMNILEQTHELGLMRSVGMSRRQVRQMVTSQAAIIGLISVLPGTIVGILLAYLLRASVLSLLGNPGRVLHSVVWLPLYLLFVYIVVIGIAWLPARRAANLNLLDCIRAD